jgi:hypothetical protein
MCGVALPENAWTLFEPHEKFHFIVLAHGAMITDSLLQRGWLPHPARHERSAVHVRDRSGRAYVECSLYVCHPIADDVPVRYGKYQRGEGPTMKRLLLFHSLVVQG